MYYTAVIKGDWAIAQSQCRVRGLPWTYDAKHSKRWNETLITLPSSDDVTVKLVKWFTEPMVIHATLGAAEGTLLLYSHHEGALPATHPAKIGFNPSGPNMPPNYRQSKVLTKGQRWALDSIYQRMPLVNFPAMEPRGGNAAQWANRGADHELGCLGIPVTYRQFRKSVCIGHDCIMVPWAGMWLGVEANGYVHS